MVVALIGITNGNIGAAIVPPLAIALFFAVIYLPLRHTVMAFWTIVLLVNNRSQEPMCNLWKGPLTLFADIFYKNFGQLTGVSMLKFNVIDVALTFFLLVMFMRTILHNNIDRHLTYPAARALKIAALVSAGAMLFSHFYGAVTGGSIKEAYWQTKALFWMPFILMICMRAFKTERDIRRLGVLLAVVCVAHVLEGSYFYFAYVRPQGLKLQYIMTHFDTVWFVLLEAILISSVVESLKRRALVNLLLVGGFVMWGLIINDRRVAFVSLAISIMIMFAFVQHRIRRWLVRAVLVTLPITGAYFIIGMHSDASIFEPVHSLTSVADDTDASNWCRNVENFDLIKTLHKNPFIGSGWGHPYDEIIISVQYKDFAYLHRPHNSMLALLAFNGGIGFYLIWIYLPVGAFLATRTYITGTKPLHRTTAIAALSVIPIYMVQCYGDLGIEDIDAAIVLSTAFACVANLVMQTGGLKEPGQRTLQDRHPTQPRV